MSLFDLIRYPVDIDFIPEDLDRLPKEVLLKWWGEMADDIVASRRPTYSYQYLMQNVAASTGRMHGYFIHRKKEFREDSLKKLKQIIEDHEPI